MSELTDALRLRHRYSVVEKIDRLVDGLDPGVAEVITDALTARHAEPEWVTEAVKDQYRVFGLLDGRADDISARLRRMGMDDCADEVETLAEQARELLIEDPY